VNDEVELAHILLLMCAKIVLFFSKEQKGRLTINWKSKSALNDFNASHKIQPILCGRNIDSGK
jgi:hypothetical protein